MASETVIKCRAEYAIGAAIVAVRWFIRWKTTGIKGYILDEVFAFSAWTFFHVDIRYDGVSWYV